MQSVSPYELDGPSSPSRLWFSRSDSDSSTAVTPLKCSTASDLNVSCDDDGFSASKSARRPSASAVSARRIEELEAGLQHAQQQPWLDAYPANLSVAARQQQEAFCDSVSESIHYRLQCDSLENELCRFKSDAETLRDSFDDCILALETRLKQCKADSEAELKRSAAAAEALRKEANQLQCAVRQLQEECGSKQSLLRLAHEKVNELEEQLAACRLSNEWKVDAQLKAASEATAAAEKQAACAIKDAEAKAVHAKLTAAAEIQRCRCETERLVIELGEAKATINDYKWRCEAMQSSLTNSQQNLTAASEAFAAAERRAEADLACAAAKFQAAQALSDAEIQRHVIEARGLEAALAESNSTVEKFIEHSCDLQQRLDRSQEHRLQMQKLLASLSRCGASSVAHHSNFEDDRITDIVCSRTGTAAC
jgi:hypothetical protein